MNHGGNVWISGDPSEWLDFSANLRPEGPPSWVLEAYHAAAETLRFYPDPEMKRVRKGLASFLGVPEECVLPTAGGVAAIDLALALRSGTVLLDSPAFSEYAARAEARGRTCADAAERTVCPGDTRVLCNPDNPTGRAFSREEALALHDSAAELGGELLVDEAFADYCAECSVRGRVCRTLTVVGSLTKILCIPGARLGYVCASPENIARLQGLALPWQLSAPAAAVAAELPAHLPELTETERVNARRRTAFAKALEGLGARVLPSRANFLLCDFGRDMTGTAAALKERGILVRTCASFGLAGNWLRLAVRTEEENGRLIGEMKECLGI